MLAAHRSGVGDFFNDAYQAMDKSKLRHNRDYLQLIRDQPLWFAPGTSERYSNGGYALLGEVIAKASGEDYYDIPDASTSSPRGHEAHAATRSRATALPGVARGYTRRDAGDGERDDEQ
jgi:CubicO group peptidase (beta-lactamase class C family)